MATHEITRPLALNVTALEIAQALQDVIVTTPVVDNLTTNDGSKALSAKMGKKLNDEKFAIANIASALGQDIDKVPSNKVVDDAINAIINHLTTPTVLYSVSGQTQISSGQINFNDNPLNYDVIVALVRHNNTGVVRTCVFFPKITDVFGMFTLYESGSMRDFYGLFNSRGAKIVDNTSGTYPWWYPTDVNSVGPTIWGFKFN